MTPTNDFIVKMAEFDYIGQRLEGWKSLVTSGRMCLYTERSNMSSSTKETWWTLLLLLLFFLFETFGAREQCTCQTSSIFIAIFFLLLYIYKYIYRSAILIVACVGRTANEKKWKERNQTQSAVTLVEALLKTCWGVGTVDWLRDWLLICHTYFGKSDSEYKS